MAPVPPATKIRMDDEATRVPGYWSEAALWHYVGVTQHSGYPGAPPGWYPDPAGGSGVRWWDGYTWRTATRPPQPGRTDVPEPTSEPGGTEQNLAGERSGYPGAPPQWYPDPAGGPGLRWWDGYAWTEATVLPERPPPPPWAAAEPQGPASEVAPWATAAQRLNAHSTARLVEDELRVEPVARVAVIMPAVYFMAGLIVLRVKAAQWRVLGHQFHVIWDDARAGITAPRYNTPDVFSPLTLVVAIATVAAVVVACIWQHRAASAARALGFPADRSPAWGVGCWFVPIVNLWMPYGAIRDCLPPGDPHRPRVLRWWIALLAAWWLYTAASLCALASSGLALAVSIPAALAALALLALSPGVVGAIGAAHRTASGGGQVG
jgi:hypothetical protein